MGASLYEKEKKGLKRSRRAAELEGSSSVIPGVVSEGAELEASRKQVFECVDDHWFRGIITCLAKCSESLAITSRTAGYSVTI